MNGNIGCNILLHTTNRMESLIRKGPVQLAKELIVLERKYDEASQSIRVLEETLLHQRELSMRNIKYAGFLIVCICRLFVWL